MFRALSRRKLIPVIENVFVIWSVTKSKYLTFLKSETIALNLTQFIFEIYNTVHIYNIYSTFQCIFTLFAQIP